MSNSGLPHDPLVAISLRNIETPAAGPQDAARRNPDVIFAEILRRAAELNPNIDLPTLRRAYLFAARKHEGHMRLSGDPFITHSLEVMRILTDLRLDTQTLAAGLLHDVVEDTGTSLEEVRLHFGEDVALIVDGVTKISGIKLHNREERQIDNFRKMLLSIAKDVRVLLVKFADRLHNMRTLEFLPADKRERIARETLDVHAPLAHRFGMGRIRRELEDLAFKYVDPDAFTQLKARVEQKRDELRDHIDRMQASIEAALRERSIPAEVNGRIKHLYSTYRKMRTQGKAFGEIYDLVAIRVIVDTPNQCYDVLAYLHQTYRPLEGRFKDYIGNPKPNGYQSLHTTVIADHGMVVEVQIRTKKMHQIAEEGIARHWLYKEGHPTEDIDSQTRWVRQFLEWSEDVQDPQEFVEQLKIDLFPDEVFILTPKGDVIILPRGATALDFAFAVHTEVGLHCTTAQVNGAVVPLGHELTSCDRVKIITSATQKPRRDWLGLVKTSRARSRIRRVLREQEYTFNLAVGRDLLDKRLRKMNVHLTDEQWAEMVEAFNMRDRDRLYAAIGGGDISIDRVSDYLRPHEELEKEAEGEETDVDVSGGIALSGVDDPMVRFSRCCNPVPGDPVIGFITRGRGISVHHRDCPNVESLMLEPDRVVPVRWEEPALVGGPGPFKTAIVVKSNDRIGLLSDVTSMISSTGANIRHAEIRTVDDGGHSAFLLEVKNLRQLKRTMAKLRRVPGVTEVYRLASTDDEDELHAMIAGRPLRLDDDEEE